MARKETPDLLGELLAGSEEPGQAPISPLPSPSPMLSQVEPDVVTWEYLLVSFSDYHGWRPRYINGSEIHQWMDAPLIHDYISQMGEDGWELVGATSGKALYGARDYYQLYFKRRRH